MDRPFFDDQDYTLNFVIPDAAAPSSTFCCVEISATYFVDATLLVPGIGLSTTEAVDVQYNNEAPLGEWLNVGNIGGLPEGAFILLTPFQIDSGHLWNGLVDPQYRVPPTMDGPSMREPPLA